MREEGKEGKIARGKLTAPIKEIWDASSPHLTRVSHCVFLQIITTWVIKL